MYQTEFNQVFGARGNSNKTVGYTDATRKQARRMRIGKTFRDKVNGHVAYQKNRRVWDDELRKFVKA